MIWFFTPYSFNGKLFDAYDQYMKLIVNTKDWAAFTDGDTLFFHPDFGDVIRKYTQTYPDTGIFVCFANRSGTRKQLYDEKLCEIDSIKYNFLIADHLRKNNQGKSTSIDCLVSGFLMVIQRKTWEIIREDVRSRVKNCFLLGVDYAIAASVLKHGMSVRRMDSLIMLHYYRFVEGCPKSRGIK